MALFCHTYLYYAPCHCEAQSAVAISPLCHFDQDKIHFCRVEKSQHLKKFVIARQGIALLWQSRLLSGAQKVLADCQDFRNVLRACRALLAHLRPAYVNSFVLFVSVFTLLLAFAKLAVITFPCTCSFVRRTLNALPKLLPSLSVHPANTYPA